MIDRRGQQDVGVASIGVGRWGPSLVRLLRDNMRSHVGRSVEARGAGMAVAA